jgi:hypothetical protein
MRRHFSRMSVLFETRATKERVLHLHECAEYVFSHRSSYDIFLKRTLCLICRIPFVNRMTLVHVTAKVSNELIAIHFHSFQIFIVQIREMGFCKPEFIIVKSNYFQNAQKSECFLDDFEGRKFKKHISSNN